MSSFEEDKLAAELKKQPVLPPANPFGQIVEGAIGLHEMYVSYVAGGFTRSEALELLALIITRSHREPDSD